MQYSTNTRIEHVCYRSRGNLLVLTRAFFVNNEIYMAFLLNPQAQGVSGKNEQCSQTSWCGAQCSCIGCIGLRLALPGTTVAFECVFVYKYFHDPVFWTIAPLRGRTCITNITPNMCKTFIWEIETSYSFVHVNRYKLICCFCFLETVLGRWSDFIHSLQPPTQWFTH